MVSSGALPAGSCRATLWLPRPRAVCPARGHRCDPAKLLLDPMPAPSTAPWTVTSRSSAMTWWTRRAGSATSATVSTVSDTRFCPWSSTVLRLGSGPPATARVPQHRHLWRRTSGHDDAQPRSAGSDSGTYAGIAHPATIQHLVDLGITAIELMPVHQFVGDFHLQDKGLANWGYNTIGFFAPHKRLCGIRHPRWNRSSEFAAMVRRSTRRDRGHPSTSSTTTRRGQPPRPDVCLPWHRQQRLLPPRHEQSRVLLRHHGTGNSLLMRNPHVLQLIMDSLRYWVTEMHVDGFRFDLAATLARQFHEVDRLSAFFDLPAGPGRHLRSNSSPSRGTSAGAIRSATSPPCGRSGTGSSATPCATYTWRGEAATLGSSPRGSTGSSDLGFRAANRSRRSTSSSPTMGSRWRTWWPTTTTRSTTRPMARTTATGRATTARGTAASRARPRPRCPRAAHPPAQEPHVDPAALAGIR